MCLSCPPPVPTTKRFPCLPSIPASQKGPNEAPKSPHPKSPHLLLAGTTTDGQRLLLSYPQSSHTQAGMVAPHAPGAPRAWQCHSHLSQQTPGSNTGKSPQGPQHPVPRTGAVTGCDTSASSRDQHARQHIREHFVHITFPTARPPTTERMTPQTLITRVCKTEKGTACHRGGTRNTTMAATGDTDPVGPEA